MTCDRDKVKEYMSAYGAEDALAVLERSQAAVDLWAGDECELADLIADLVFDGYDSDEQIRFAVDLWERPEQGGTAVVEWQAEHQKLAPEPWDTACSIEGCESEARRVYPNGHYCALHDYCGWDEEDGC